MGCSDSRASPEIIFDRSIGDIFVIRVAGNVLGQLELDSIEYSILHNGSVVVVVLGHENCGAIKAVLSNDTKDIEAVAKLITPAIADAKGSIEMAVKANVRSIVSNLNQNQTIKKYIDQGKLKIVGGYYNLSSGKVDFI